MFEVINRNNGKAEILDMRIGIDLDGVVLDTEREFRNAAELYDLKVLGRDSNVDPTSLLIQKRYDWSEEELVRFINEYFLECTRRCHVMPGAKECLELLKNDGHTLVLITARGNEIKEMRPAAEAILDREGISFDKYYWAVDNKAEVCKNENIDLMIEDSIINCEALAKEHVRCVYLRDANMRTADSEYIRECFVWGEVYRYICGAME